MWMGKGRMVICWWGCEDGVAFWCALWVCVRGVCLGRKLFGFMRFGDG